MKLSCLLAASLVALGMLTAVAIAQDNPPPREGQRDREVQPPRRVDEGDRPAAQRRPRGDGEVPNVTARPEGERRIDAVRAAGERRPVEGAGRPVRPLPGVGFDQVDRMREWLDVIERYTRMAHNPTDAGIAAVVTANDLLRPRGPEQAIDYFRNMLGEVKNEAVQRAIRLQLVELYKATGQQEQALDQLRALMVGATTEPPKP